MKTILLVWMFVSSFLLFFTIDESRFVERPKAQVLDPVRI